MGRTGVLIVTTGGPSSIPDIDPFVEAVAGRPLSPEELSAARGRYLAIGGMSPVPAVAERVAAALERALNGLEPAPVEFNPVDTLTALTDTSSPRAEGPLDVRVLVGMRASLPTVEQSLAELKADGVERIVAVDLLPFEPPSQRAANHAYLDAVASALGLEVVGAEATEQPALRDFLSVAYRETIDMVLGDHAPIVAVFTASAVGAAEAVDHVQRVERAAALAAEDLFLAAPDPSSLATALGVAGFGAGGDIPWVVAYQSAVPVADAAGPELFQVLDEAFARGFKGVAVLPIGFASDEVETMWTLDILAADACLERDVEFVRCAAVNDHGAVIEALAQAIRPLL